MNEPLRISPLAPRYRSQDFEFLRAQGLSVIQALAAESWTDHNLHDPGITILEAACYAITEAGLRAGMDVQHLLASSAASRPPELFTAREVLPAAPVTAIDLRKVLTDHPLVTNAWVFPLMSVPLGRLSVLLEFADESLNSNIFSGMVAPPGLAGPYRISLAFPHWDDPDVRPLRQDVALLAVSFGGPPGSEWNPIEGSTSFFTRAAVTYQPPAGAAQVLELWVVAQIITGMADSGVEAPPVLQAVTASIDDLGASGPLKALNRRVTQAFEAMRVVRRYALPHRGLCEDLVEFNAVRLQEVGVSAILEVGSGVAVEELLAEIFFRIDRLIAPEIRFTGLDARLQQVGSADAAFDGPLTDSGFVDDRDLAAQQVTGTVYTSDILRLIYQLRHADDTDLARREDVSTRRIIAVRSLTLSNHMDNRPITTLARDCLRLVKSQRHVSRLSLEKSRIVVFRNGVEIGYDLGRVAELLARKKAATAQAVGQGSADLPVPPGEPHPVGEYYPIQNDLPAVYGVGEAGLPEHVPAARRAQARQLKGYLFPFEQTLAGFNAQLAQFNAFFSADPGIEQTLFQQSLYYLPDIAPLFRAYDPGSMSWAGFQSDSSNAYARVLRDAVESREQFLERRNALLDHLLATLGEEMRDRSALLFRLAAEVPDGTALSLPALLEARRKRRLEALNDLIENKSDYYHDVPALDRDQGQAFGHPLWSTGRLATITRAAAGYVWQVADASGTPLFRQVAASASSREAERMIEQVVQLATLPARYAVRLETGGRRRLEIRASAGAAPLAESVATFGTDPQAQAGIAAAADAVLGAWAAHALIPLEWRLQHLLGLDVRERRRLVHEIGDYLEVFDEAVDPNNEKGFRLRELPGPGGAELLVNVVGHPGATDAAARAAALAAARLLGVHGIRARSYRVEETGPNSWRVVLALPDGTPLARSPATFPSPEAARAAADRVRLHLFRLFSGEGLFLVEHHLLFPSTAAGAALTIPGQHDPYSFQVTVVLPSGFGRDFSQPAGAAQPLQPTLYGNAEFRRYAEQQVRRHCPALVLPRVLWVDRTLPGTPVAPTGPSLDAFEHAYFDWLRAYLTDETDDATLGARCDTLTTVINALYQRYYTA